MTVVPLTTAVMSSVADSKSGIASGINNSVTRISGTFINALLGAFAIVLFSNYVSADQSLSSLDAIEMTVVLEQASQLGEATAPVSISSSNVEKVNTAYDLSFVKTYQWVGRLSATLAWLSALIAMIMVEPKKLSKD